MWSRPDRLLHPVFFQVHFIDKKAIMQKLVEKIAVITGGSSGIGLAIAKQFVKEGAYVFITGRRQEALDKAVAEIGSNVTAMMLPLPALWRSNTPRIVTDLR